jgi:hypothetical protein
MPLELNLHGRFTSFWCDAKKWIILFSYLYNFYSGYKGREADHSPPSSAEVKEWVELYLHSPMRLHGVVLS